MSSVDCLREFVNERLTAAAEEIFGVFRKTIIDLEEKIDHQRRLLDIAWKPELKLHRIELPQQHVCTEDEVLCIQERSSSLDQEDPELLQIKEEQEELYTSQEGEQLLLKHETDAFILTATNEESRHSEDETMYWNFDETVGSAINMPVVNVVVSEPDRDHQLLFNNSRLAECQDQKGDEHGDSGSTRNTEPRPSKSHTKNEHNSTASTTKPKNNTGNKSLDCKFCGKTFSSQWALTCHIRTHTGEKPFFCKICEKAFRSNGELTVHTRTHTGEKPYTCQLCGRDFGHSSHLAVHKRRAHTGERPHCCKICGKGFIEKDGCKRHMRIHTGEKPYLCYTCGKSFIEMNGLKRHMRTHTDSDSAPVMRESSLD